MEIFHFKESAIDVEASVVSKNQRGGYELRF